jgi:hypothetical protein
MSQGIAKTGDIGSGICTGHKKPIPMTGILLATSSTVKCENVNVGLVGDIVLGYCGHIGVMVTSASTVTAEKRSVVRIGDAFAGTFSGVLITGSPTVTAS